MRWIIILFYFIFYLWLCWVFVSVRGLSLVAASGDHSSSRCASLSLSQPLLLWSTGSRRAGSVIVAHRPSCSMACGIFPDQGSNPRPPALAGRFSTTAPPEKPEMFCIFYFTIYSLFISFWLFYVYLLLCSLVLLSFMPSVLMEALKTIFTKFFSFS